MHVRFSEDALSDLKNIRDYIEPRSPQGFQRVTAAILTTAAQLETFPLLGHEGRIETTYEIVVPRTPFIIVYSLPDSIYVDIDRVLHGRQRYPLVD